MTPQKRNVLMPTAIAAALLACFGTAAANEWPDWFFVPGSLTHFTA